MYSRPKTKINRSFPNSTKFIWVFGAWKDPQGPYVTFERKRPKYCYLEVLSRQQRLEVECSWYTFLQWYVVMTNGHFNFLETLLNSMNLSFICYLFVNPSSMKTVKGVSRMLRTLNLQYSYCHQQKVASSIL